MNSTGGSAGQSAGAGGGAPTGGGGATSGGSAGSGGSVAGSAGSAGTAAGGGGTGGSGGSGGTGGTGGGGGSSLPGYDGTPFKALQIPGTIYAADYDRGGAGVAYCHGNENDCGAGVVTNDWAPADTPPYREPMPPGGQVCGGAACDDNIGLCRHNPAKPDNTIDGDPVTPIEPYLCYTTAGQWTKYTVQVMEAGTYQIDGFLAAPGGVTISLDFGDGVTTGTFPVPESPTGNCACTESYHAWAVRENLATVTFAAAGTYLMTFNIVSAQFNPGRFVFTKI